jgi:hypothetical protein
MKQGEAATVRARITISISEEFVRSIEANDRLESRLASSIITTSKAMEVTLAGIEDGAFDIKNLTPTIQNVSSDKTGYTEWVWDVIPKLPGKQTLVLRAYTIEDNGYRTRKEVTMKNIQVDVNPLWWVEENYQWILGSGFVGSILIFLITKKWKKNS